MKNFEKLGIDPPVLKIIEKMGFSEPMEIQAKTIPLGLEGKDIVAMSATGSGKTLVFATILIHNIDKERGIQALILTPTRELTEQVAQTIQLFARSKHMEVAKVIGGMPINRQIQKLERANIVVGTPGRILDHIGRKTLDLSTVKILVLDEADRMFDMGFIRDVEKIMNYCPKQKQTMLFSATITGAVLDLAEKHMRNPVSISVDNFVDPSKLRQAYYETDRAHKFSLLLHLIRTEESGLAMVFCNSRRGVDFVQKNLAANGINAHALHGGMTQPKRNKVISGFHSNDIHVLVCTDVAARGLDIKGVRHIYNYNLPHDPIDYTHRIGRTARAGAEGMAISLLTEEEYPNFRRIMGRDNIKIERMELPQLEQVRLIGKEPQEKPRDGNWSRRPRRNNNSRRPTNRSKYKPRRR